MIEVSAILAELRNTGIEVKGKKGVAKTPKLSYPVVSLTVEGMPSVSEALTFAINQKSYLHELGKARKTAEGKEPSERKQAEYTDEL